MVFLQAVFQSPLPFQLAASPLPAVPPPKLYFAFAYTIPPATQAKTATTTTTTKKKTSTESSVFALGSFRQLGKEEGIRQAQIYFGAFYMYISFKDRLWHTCTLYINACQFKILLYAFKLAQLTSFESKNSFELSTQRRG